MQFDRYVKICNSKYQKYAKSMQKCEAPNMQIYANLVMCK